MAFCLVDGSILSAPYDPVRSKSSGPAREANPPATEVLNPRTSPDLLPPSQTAPKDVQSTIHSPFVPQPAYSQQSGHRPHSSAPYGSDHAPRKFSIAKIFIALGTMAVVLVSLLVILQIMFATRRSTAQNIMPPTNVNATNLNSRDREGDLAANGANDEAKVREQLRNDPNNEELNRRLAIDLLMEKKLDDAELYARKAVRLAPNSSPPHYALSQVLNRQGKTAEAQAELKLADKLKAKE